MASWGDVQVYNEMIEDIGSFIRTVSVACETMGAAVQTCVANMENDKASLQASKNVIESIKKYEEAMAAAQNLSNNLADERDAIIEYLRTLEDFESNGDE